MNLPFTSAQFFQIFADYNNAVWPAQIVLITLAFAAVYLSFKGGSSGKVIAGILALLWAWTGIIYHFAFFSAINRGAYLFSLLCIGEASLFLIVGLFKGKLNIRPSTSLTGILGSFLLLYALVLYPGLGYLLGHIYPQSPTFGAPCPTTIFTFGILLWSDRRTPRTLLIIPLLWSLIGSTAAFMFGILEDLGLLLSGIIGLLSMFLVGRQPTTQAAK